MSRSSYTVDATRAGRARTTKGLTQNEAALRLGVNRITLNRIENGRANVSLDLLERMADLFGCSREWLLGDEEPADELEAGRERIALALSKISEGFEELTDVLNQRVRDARDEPAAVEA